MSGDDGIVITGGSVTISTPESDPESPSRVITGGLSTESSSESGRLSAIISTESSESLGTRRKRSTFYQNGKNY